MTTITAVIDTDQRIWQVSNLLSPEQASAIINLDWTNLRNKHEQLHFKQRREIVWDEPAIQAACTAISDQLPAINRALGTEFTQASGAFWIDYPGFSCPMHTDGHLAASMQLYWLAPDHSYGTGFYRYKTPESLVYQFASCPNSGYIMLNHANPNGSQPLLWHAMLNTVPPGTIRVSSYWQFK
jgi:hypothetical protein